MSCEVSVCNRQVYEAIVGTPCSVKGKEPCMPLGGAYLFPAKTHRQVCPQRDVRGEITANSPLLLAEYPSNLNRPLETILREHMLFV